MYACKRCLRPKVLVLLGVVVLGLLFAVPLVGAAGLVFFLPLLGCALMYGAIVFGKRS